MAGPAEHEAWEVKISLTRPPGPWQPCSWAQSGAGFVSGKGMRVTRWQIHVQKTSNQLFSVPFLVFNGFGGLGSPAVLGTPWTWTRSKRMGEKATWRQCKEQIDKITSDKFLIYTSKRRRYYISEIIVLNKIWLSENKEEFLEIRNMTSEI